MYSNLCIHQSQSQSQSQSQQQLGHLNNMQYMDITVPHVYTYSYTDHIFTHTLKFNIFMFSLPFNGFISHH